MHTCRTYAAHAGINAPCELYAVNNTVVFDQVSAGLAAEATADSSFEAKIDSAWAEVGRHLALRRAGQATEAEDPQRTFSRTFFQYYREHTTTKTGKRALQAAFMMWGHTREADEVKRALPYLDGHSDDWHRLLHGIQAAYATDNRSAEYVELLHDLESPLTHPRSLSALFLHLGDAYLERHQETTAKSYYERVYTLQADSFDVAQAEGHLSEIATLRVGMTAPDFSAQDLAGNTITLSASRDKVTLLVIWATWWWPSLVEIQQLTRMQESLQDETFQLISISVDTALVNLKQFVEEKKIGLPPLWQEPGKQENIATLYHVSGLSRVFLIDRTGTIAAKDLRGAALEQAIRALLKTSSR